MAQRQLDPSSPQLLVQQLPLLASAVPKSHLHLALSAPLQVLDLLVLWVLSYALDEYFQGIHPQAENPLLLEPCHSLSRW